MPSLAVFYLGPTPVFKKFLKRQGKKGGNIETGKFNFTAFRLI
jgi:hypothetical protein